MFPIGSLSKSIVKSMASESGFEDIASKKESMGICFIGKRKKGFQRFIADYIDGKRGQIIDIETDVVIGEHQGLHQWTVGQRVCRSGLKHKNYVAKKDFAKNILWVCEGSDNPVLFCEHFFTTDPHWIYGQPGQLRDGDKTLECEFR